MRTFHVEESDFGAHRRFRFEHPDLEHGFDIVPTVGANVTQIRFSRTNILDGYETPEELDVGQWGKSTILFPFPNRLRDGTYSWHDQHFAFPINNASTQNAIHGFVRHESFQVERIELTKDLASITCRFVADGKNAAYPFPFTLDATFTITAQSQFIASFSVTNHAHQSIPIGLGWHPYFHLTERADDHQLQLPPCTRVEIDERMIPTGKRSAYDDFQDERSIQEKQLDTCFAVLPGQQVWRAKLHTKDRTLTVCAPYERFPFFQVFTPPARTSVAIEPMTCNIDAFHNGEGLVTLSPTETWTASFEIEHTNHAV